MPLREETLRLLAIAERPLSPAQITVRLMRERGYPCTAERVEAALRRLQQDGLATSSPRSRSWTAPRRVQELFRQLPPRGRTLTRAA